MAMSAQVAGEGDPIIEMNTTPLIDVLLVLLIMFIITVPLMTHTTSLQMSGTTTAQVPEVVYVDIDFDGAVFWNGTLVADFEQLERFFRTEAGRQNQADVQVRPDRRAMYDSVARVLALAQRSGIERIGIAGGTSEN